MDMLRREEPQCRLASNNMLRKDYSLLLCNTERILVSPQLDSYMNKQCTHELTGHEYVHTVSRFFCCMKYFTPSTKKAEEEDYHSFKASIIV